MSETISLSELSGGTLLWMRSNQKFGIHVPLDLLTKEQRASLEQYLRQDDQLLDNSNSSRLIWEYHHSPDQALLVPVIELTKEQKVLLDPPKPKPEKAEYIYSNTNFVALREQLIKNKKGWQEILSILQNISGRPWATKAWKQKREELIGDTCEMCGTKEGPMVLQHTRQPRKPDTVIRDYEKRYREELTEWVYSKPIIPDVSQYPKDADACPKCNSQVVKYQKTKQTWICVGVENGVRCGHVFAEPVKVVSKWTIRDLERQEIKNRKVSFFEKKGIGQKIALDALNDLIRYLNMESVITLCKRCAFIADKTRLVLCQYCKRNYHKKGYVCCRECAGKNR